ncbi:DUF559 domain-containing protein [Streptomyces mesophilus]|uniref:DUF559 domain-containing protein n=1 Tax=Streptomyces mesophilus TaxID=1775132 RepID=UPI00331CC544
MRELRGIVRHGVLLLADAVAAGWSRGAVYGRVRKEGWVRLGTAAWAVPGAEVDVGMRVRAVQAASPHLIASHRTAARLQSIELFAHGDGLEFTDLRGANRKLRSDVKVHRCALAVRETREVDDGLRVTTPLRTLTDLLRAGSLDDALTAVDSALTWRGRGDTRRPPLVGLDHLTAAAGELPYAGGRRKAQHRLALADPRSESVAETIARLRMVEAGLRPESQVELAAGRGRRVCVDFLFREQRVAVEIEGYAYHGSREAHVRDLGRFNALQSCPEIDTVLRFTAVQVFASPATVIARIREALGAA